MFATQLIGKRAIRTGSTTYPSGSVSLSFTEEPILILHATKSHIIFKWQPESHIKQDEPDVLNAIYCDDKWTDYDCLMWGANPILAREVMKKIAAGPPHNPQIDQILGLMREGKKINAVNTYREVYGSGLKEALEAVNSWYSKYNIPEDRCRI